MASIGIATVVFVVYMTAWLFGFYFGSCAAEEDYAAKKGKLKKDDLAEHQDGNCCGKAAEAGGCNCTGCCTPVKVEKEEVQEGEENPTPIEVVWAFHHLGQLTGIALTEPQGQERGRKMWLVDPRCWCITSAKRAK